MALTLTQPLNPFKVVNYGVAFRLIPGKDAGGTFWRGGFEVQRAPDSGGSPGTPVTIYVSDRPLPTSGGVFVDPLPPALTYYHYRWRHVGPGFDAGPYSSYIKRAADQLPKSVLEVSLNRDPVYPIARDQPLTDGKYALIAATNTGVLVDPIVQLDPGNGIKEGGVVYKLYRHREEITVQGADSDGDVPVTFAQSYQAVPLLFFRGGQYVSYSSVLGNVMQRQRFQALNVTTGGFTSRTQIVNTGSLTARSDDFASGNLIDAVAETAEVDLDPGAANDDTYTVNYRVSVTLSNPGVDPSVSLTVAIETNDGGGGGWIERATFVYSRSSAGTSTWNTESKPIVVSGLGTNDDIRLRAKSFVVHDAPGSSFEVRGADAGGSNPDTRNGVTYTTATDDADSAIPDAGDSVVWVAQEVT